MNREKRFDLLALLVCLLLALAFRLPGLTVFLTADEARSWYGRSIIFLDSLLRGDFANTAPGGVVPFIENVSLSPAPGVTTMWTGTLGIILTYWRQGAPGELVQFLTQIPFDPLDPAMLFCLRLPGVLITVLAVGLTYWWSRRLIGRWGALLAAGLLALDPFYLALSRVLGHDALVTTFMWLSLLAFLRVMAASNDVQNKPPSVFKHPRLSFILLSGAFAGLAFLSKYPALFVGLFIAVVMLIIYLRRDQPIRTALINWGAHLALWFMAAGIIFVLFWPAMWVNPFGPVMTIINDALRASGSPHQKGSFFLGQPVPDPGLLFYPLIAWLRATPVVLAGVLLSLWPLFQRLIGRQTEDEKEGSSYFLYICLWIYVLLYMLLVTYGGKKQDRYLLPAFPAMMMLAAMAYTYISHFVSRLIRLKWILPVALLSLQLILVYPYYPYYFSYYNPLSGGAKTAANLVQIGWGEGLDQAAAYLNTLPGAEVAEVTSWYSTTFEPYFKGRAIYKIEEEKISRSAKPGLAADYVVFYVNQIQRRLPSEGGLAYFQQNAPLHTVTLGGQDYAWIYPAPGVDHIIEEETRLVGQAELLGFDWFADNGQRLEAIPAGNVAHLKLYWEWQGKAETDPIQLSLVDSEGFTWGWGYPQPVETEKIDGLGLEGEIVVSDYALAVFPGTPPGQYYLRVWIERPDTEEVVGQFPLAAEDAAVTIVRSLTPAQPDDFEIGTRLDSSFGLLQLLGYNLSPQVCNPGEQCKLELFWALPASNLTEDALATLTLASASAAGPIPNPARWERLITPSYPTSMWQPGDHFHDVWLLALPHQVPKGHYDLQLMVNGRESTIGQIEVGGRQRNFDRPDIKNTLTARVGDSIELLGYHLDSQLTTDNPQLSLTLFWQAVGISPKAYTVFAQLLNADNQVVAQQDSQPQGGVAPTDTWAVGEIVVDEYTLRPESLEDGTYRLIVGMYRADTGERLLIRTEENAETDALTLTILEKN